eukprot:TRINITY_DN21950_c0_g1_i9.p1 TRINITY_DN21950_c0_g1~~TRINITY_DN21950_c0_g1_i9.p1  ORF type:complete len:244 (+),score=26.74 TRINITY_DN21950_c0_g1_i9:56-787(+)
MGRLIRFAKAVVVVRSVSGQAAQDITCRSVVTPGGCPQGTRCANESAPAGIRKRSDAATCCCAESAPIIWTDTDAKCHEQSKCVFRCCGGRDKLCGGECCTRSQKCDIDKCVAKPRPTPSPSPRPGPAPSPSPQPSPAPPRQNSDSSWWPHLPGPLWLSEAVDLVLAGTAMLGIGAATPTAVRRVRRMRCIASHAPRLALEPPAQQSALMDTRFFEMIEGSSGVGVDSGAGGARALPSTTAQT